MQSRNPRENNYAYGPALVLLHQDAIDFTIYDQDKKHAQFKITQYVNLFSVLHIAGALTKYEKDLVLDYIKLYINAKGDSIEISENIGYRVAFYTKTKIQRLDGVNSTVFTQAHIPQQNPAQMRNSVSPGFNTTNTFGTSEFKFTSNAYSNTQNLYPPAAYSGVNQPRVQIAQPAGPNKLITKETTNRSQQMEMLAGNYYEYIFYLRFIEY